MSSAKNSIIDFIKSYTSENLDIKYEIELIFQDVLNCKKIDLYTNKNLSINNNQGHIIDVGPPEQVFKASQLEDVYQLPFEILSHSSGRPLVMPC